MIIKIPQKTVSVYKKTAKIFLPIIIVRYCLDMKFMAVLR